MDSSASTIYAYHRINHRFKRRDPIGGAGSAAVATAAASLAPAESAEYACASV